MVENIIKTFNNIIFNIINNIVMEQKLDISNPFISVDYWITKADICINQTYKNRQHNYSYEKEFNDAYEKKSKIIVFLKTDLIETYIDTLLNIRTPFILIMASNDDHCVPYLYFPCRNNDLKEKSKRLLDYDNLLSIYAKNPCIEHPKIYPIPIGPKWQWKTTQFFGEPKKKHMIIYNKFCLSPRERILNIESKPNLVYLNFTSQTTNAPLYSNHRNIRKKILDNCKNKFDYIGNEPFEKYIEILSTYKFSISPPGRGIDAHRTWESLMMGTIPIICESPMNIIFEKLPVIIVNDNDWDKITPEYLENKHKYILSHINDYEFDICYTHFWDNILNY